MAKLEVIKNEEKGLYEYKFTYDSGVVKSLPFLSSETHKAIEDYFKPKVKRKDKQPAPAPKLEDVKEYFKSKGYTNESACKFYEYYDTTGWRGANGSPILNWKSKALAVWFVDKNKIKKNTSTSSFFR